MKIKSIVLALASVIVFSCNQTKEEQATPEIDYKFTSDKTTNIENCSDKDLKLLDEALLTFENNIKTKYNVNDRNINRAYMGFLNDTRINRINLSAMATKHTKTVFDALKTRNDIWTENGQLDYNSDIVKCIANNITDKNLKTTFNALLSTNSMDFKMYGEAIRTKSATLRTDKYLALFLALDLYYAKLHNVDLSNVKEAGSNIDFNKRPPKPQQIKQQKIEATKKDPHAGHNHD